jgi:hypothetical protein
LIYQSCLFESCRVFLNGTLFKIQASLCQMPQGKKVTVMKKYPHLIHTNLTSAGSDDVFLTKYDSNGSLVWVNQAGGANQDIGQNVCADTNGNVYAVGKLPRNSNPTDQVALTRARRLHWALSAPPPERRIYPAATRAGCTTAG